MLKLNKCLFLWPFLLMSSLSAAAVTPIVTEKLITAQQTLAAQAMPLQNIIALLQKDVIDHYVLQLLTQYMEANALNCARYLDQLNLVKLIQQYVVSNNATITLLKNNITLLDTALDKHKTMSRDVYWQELRADMALLLQQKSQSTQVLQHWAPKFEQKGLLRLKDNATGLQKQLSKLKAMPVQKLKAIISAAEVQLQKLGRP